MLATSLIQKLWDKGVDISAGVITGVVTSSLVAAIGLLGWRVKIQLDLRAEEKKQRQHYRITQELEHEKTRTEAQERLNRLTAEREQFANALPTLGRGGQAELWNRFLEWMKSNNLHLIPGNAHAFEMVNWSQSLADAMDGNVEVNARNMRKIILDTKLS